MAQQLPLADAIEQLRDALLQSHETGDVKFMVPFVTIGAGVKRSRETVHTVTVTVAFGPPVDRNGYVVDIANSRPADRVPSASELDGAMDLDGTAIDLAASAPGD